MVELIVKISSHNFAATFITPRSRPAIVSFATTMIQYGFARGQMNKMSYAPLKVYAASTRDRSEYRFHINQLNDFKRHMERFGLKGDMVVYEQLPIPVGTTVEFLIGPQWVERDYQPPIIAYLANPDPPIQKFLDLQTGRGKSFCSMSAMVKIGKRVVIIVKPMYIVKWKEDMERTFTDISDDIMIVQGSGQLMALLELARNDDLSAKIIIISNKTLQNWYKMYEQFKHETLELGYACLPQDMFGHLGAGVRLIDEVHQDFHLNWKIDMYTNVAHAMSLSATLLSDDGFVAKMHGLAYPVAERYKSPAYHKYISAKAVMYRFREPQKIRTTDPGSNTYTHHQFEKSIIRNPQTLKNYLGLINTLLMGSYMREYKKTQRLLVFCISVEMCTIVREYLANQHPTLDVRRYVEEDPYSNLMESDICVTTLQSAGTAVDVPNLKTVILTIAVASTQANVQGFGRLRELKDGTTPEFLYLVCEDIPKHLEYHEQKRVILESRALRYKPVFIGTPV